MMMQIRTKRRNPVPHEQVMLFKYDRLTKAAWGLVGLSPRGGFISMRFEPADRDDLAAGLAKGCQSMPGSQRDDFWV
jgi:hypothetical protein